ncbi:FAD-dependent oxidoreductase [Dactylosporangium sp. NBC_01737]|uniref:FAD-dependent oxidoreductase n=1 Tax=Dactylosporangium sp. NBC_01737 TaxID=2975959 RepID=UPI002E0DAC4E|nr:FAD-dependent oxidoreductase [Dactylosporangium sp. NBC_01737]
MRRAVIVGAGVAGLATALRLGRDGWDTVVVERAPARRTGGYVVNLLGPGYDAAERLGLLPALAAHALGPFTTVLVHADGRAKLTVPAALAEAALGERTVSVFRGDLESTLYEAVRDHTDLRFGTTVTAAGEGPDVLLSDGTTLTADLLVGADGVHSATRPAVFGDGHRVDLPYVVAAFPVAHASPERSATTFIGPGRTAALIDLGPGRSCAFFAYRCETPLEALCRGPVEALGAAFGDLGGGIPDALRHLGRDPGGAYFDTVSQVVLPRWSSGRTVLLGDAAWCVTVFAGHGAGLALAGADRLGTALREHGTDVTAALAQWETGLRPAVVRRQAQARRGMLQYAPPTRFHVWLGDLMVRAVTLPGVRGLVRRAAART